MKNRNKTQMKMAIEIPAWDNKDYGKSVSLFLQNGKKRKMPGKKLN